MWRRLWRAVGLVVLCLLAVLSVAAAVLTIASFRQAYSVFYQHRMEDGWYDTWTYIARGNMWIGRMRLGHLPRPRPLPAWRFERTRADPVVYELPLVRRLDIGFGYTPRKTHPSGMYGFVVPVWFIALVLGTAPGWSLVRALRRRRRLGANCCVHCGYDLRATPDRCPECGTEVQPPRPPAPAPVSQASSA